VQGNANEIATRTERKEFVGESQQSGEAGAGMVRAIPDSLTVEEMEPPRTAGRIMKAQPNES